MAELFKPQSTALTELWVGEEKVAEMEYWLKELHDEGINIKSEMLKDNGKGIITSDKIEPLYGNRYLPKKFKVAVTVPGDNSLDIYTNDIGLVVIVDEKGNLEGFNVMVGGGMGRTHMKESTFARVADHLGFVPADDIIELSKAILATQRDHGNREIRANSRMKYLVHEKGIDNFRKIVEVINFITTEMNQHFKKIVSK
jgi:sulfite reductase (ferredoxin)